MSIFNFNIIAKQCQCRTDKASRSGFLLIEVIVSIVLLLGISSMLLQAVGSLYYARDMVVKRAHGLLLANSYIEKIIADSTLFKKRVIEGDYVITCIIKPDSKLKNFAFLHVTVSWQGFLRIHNLSLNAGIVIS